MKNAITELQSQMDAAVTTMDEAEPRISDTYGEDKLIENNEAEKKRDMKGKELDLRIRESSDSLKGNIRIIGVAEEEDRKIGVEGLCEQIIGENFPNLEDTDIKIQEAQRILIRFNKNRPSTKCIIVKFTKYSGKERIMKAARGKKFLTYKGRKIRFAADLSTETWQARKEWQDIFNVLNQENMQPRILYPARLSFKIEGEIQSFPDKKN